MASRRLADLAEGTREKAYALLQAAEAADFDVLIYCTFRPLAEQARLFRQGRPLYEIQLKAAELDERWGRPDLAELLMGVGPQYGRKVTNAAPGQSIHNYRMAMDGCPLRGGKPVWGDETPEDLALWRRYGELAESVGLEWAGRWKRFREMPHIQEPDVDWKVMIGAVEA